MTSQDRQRTRRDVAAAAGYEPKPLPADVPWAGVQLPEPTDDRSHRAALALRGIKPQLVVVDELHRHESSIGK